MVAKLNRLLLEYTSSFFDEDPRTFVEDVAKLNLRNGSEVTFDFFLVSSTTRQSFDGTPRHPIAVQLVHRSVI